MREKLIELLLDLHLNTNGHICDGCGSYSAEKECEEIADHLIANGVTIQRWIPVTERLPKEEDADIGGCVLAIEKSDGFARRWEIQGILNAPEFFTHWMPLPEPPKGE